MSITGSHMGQNQNRSVLKYWLLSAPLLKVFNFWWFNGKPISWQKVKVLTALGKMRQRNGPAQIQRKLSGGFPHPWQGDCPLPPIANCPDSHYALGTRPKEGSRKPPPQKKKHSVPKSVKRNIEHQGELQGAEKARNESAKAAK